MILDRDEKRIRSALLSNRPVDIRRIERNVKENMKMNTIEATPRKKAGVFIAACVAIMVLMVGTVYAAVALGAFDRFVEEHDPPFADVVTPVEIYVVDQGVRMEVLAAQQFHDTTIVYMSLQDISGQNRMTNEASVFPFISTNDRHGFGWMGSELIYFNQDTNTAYFEIRTQLSSNIGETNSSIELIVNEITFYRHMTVVDFPMPLSDITTAATKEFPTMNSDNNFVLVPNMAGMFPALPGSETWISNVGIVDGYLHVQLASTSFVGYGISLYAADGSMVFPHDQTWFEADENFQLLNRENIIVTGYEDNRAYNFAELVFPVNVNELESYSLMLRGSAVSSVQGNWGVTAYIGDSSNLIRVWEGELPMGNIMIERIVVNPLGVGFIGSAENMDTGIASMHTGLFGYVSVETPDGIILVRENPSIGISMDHESFSREDALAGVDIVAAALFNGFAMAETPIDVDSVTAVIIGGVRIPLE